MNHLLITGIPGVGKTTVVQKALEQLSDGELANPPTRYAIAHICSLFLYSVYLCTIKKYISRMQHSSIKSGG